MPTLMLMERAYCFLATAAIFCIYLNYKHEFYILRIKHVHLSILKLVGKQQVLLDIEQSALRCIVCTEIFVAAHLLISLPNRLASKVCALS